MKLVIVWDNGQSWEDHSVEIFTTEHFDSIQECKDRFEKEKDRFNKYDLFKKPDDDYFTSAYTRRDKFVKRSHFGNYLNDDATIQVYEFDDWFVKFKHKK